MKQVKQLPPKRKSRSTEKFTWETVGERQAEMLRAIHEFDIVFATGPAGTGKTLVSTFTGLTYLDERKVDGIVVTRPLIEVDGKLGALPGGVEQKVSPHLATIDEFLKDHPRYQELTYAYDPAEEKPLYRELETIPLELMRGRTFNRKYVIFDEAQNATKRQMEMVLTRLGKESKLVITGDVTQCDLLRPELNGLSHALSILGNHPRIKVCTFTLDDVQRHGLVADVIRAYSDDREQQTKGRTK